MIITLTTDFGLKDPFVGAMKGVILGRNPGVRIVDISHEIPSFDVMEASIVIGDACRFFPAGTVHMVVVDPGVGSARRPIALKGTGPGADQIFVGPDNGVFTLVYGTGPAHHISNTGLFHHPVSQTFHGRDIFAPVAAYLATGAPIESVGPAVTGLVTHSSSRKPSVLRVDKFGNVLTNLRRNQLGSDFVIRAGGIEVRRLLSSYSEAIADEVFAIEGSAGLIELSLNLESAADRLKLQRGAEFEVETGRLNQ
jgi:S-adenosyl-L-methionine hydrolase (adenosine-forming)